MFFVFENIVEMGIAGQTFIIFILVMLIAFLVSVGIDYSIRTQIERSKPNAKDLIAVIGRGEDSIDEKLDIEHEIRKFEKLRGPDIIANKAAIDEVSNRLYKRINDAHLSNQTRSNLLQNVELVKKELDSV